VGAVLALESSQTSVVAVMAQGEVARGQHARYVVVQVGKFLVLAGAVRVAKQWLAMVVSKTPSLVLLDPVARIA